MPLIGTAAAADHVPMLSAIEALETCVESKVSAEECVRLPFEMCEGSEFFGEVEGAGRGWCEGHVQEVWEYVVSRAENTRLCANRDASLDLAIRVAAESANRAWRSFRDAECELAAVRDYRGVGSGTSAMTVCFAQLGAQRLDELRQEREACE
jgi:Lysozyme inhibitor LprI